MTLNTDPRFVFDRIYCEHLFKRLKQTELGIKIKRVNKIFVSPKCINEI